MKCYNILYKQYLKEMYFSNTIITQTVFCAKN